MSYNNFTIFQDIKQQTDCMELSRELGLDVSSGGMVRCPDPGHEDKDPSCKVYPEGLYCYGCGKRWGAIDVVMLVKGCGLMAAARWLAEWAGIPWPEQDKGAQQEYEKHANRQRELQKRIAAWAENLRDQDLGRLKSRGFTDEFIKEQNIGFCGQKLPRNQEAARHLGLVVATKDGRDWYMPHDRITIPFYQYGQPVQVAFYKPGKNGKYLYPAGWPKPLVGIETVHWDPRAPFLVEGVFDYLSLRQAGLPAICSLGTRLSGRQREQLARAPGFFIAFDGDDPGRTAARELARDFFPAGKIIDLPDGKDVNDMLKDLGQKQFKTYMQETANGAKDHLDTVISRLGREPGGEGDQEDAGLRADAMAAVARVPSLVEGEVRIEQLSKALKPLGIGKVAIRQEVDALRKERAAEESAEEKKDETQQDILLKIAQQAEVFKDEHNTPFARILKKQNRPVWGRDFKMWLTGQYLEESGRGPNSEALNATINTVAAMAWKSEKQHRLNVRTAAHKDSFYYDLGDQGWTAVRVYPGGWEVDENPPILFKRYAHMAEQALPVPGGDPWKLLDFVNIRDEENKLLFLVSVVTDFVPDIPHVIKNIYGPEGSTKTTSAKTARDIIDPSAAPTCRAYRDKKEFMQYLAHNYCCLLDNLSGISAELSDLICSAVTGDGDTKRALFTDDDDIIYNFKRCFIVNGINNVVVRPDLLRRAVLFPLKALHPSDRMEEKKYWQKFEEAKPGIMGGIFDTLAQAMQIYPNIKLSGLYDMADYTRWGTAIAQALERNPADFLNAYRKNKATQNEEALSNNAVASAIVVLMEKTKKWSGTATALLGLLDEIADEEKINIRAKGWPKAANSLSRKLNELEATLLRAGVKIYRDRQDKRTIFIEAIEPEESIVNIVESADIPMERGFAADDTADDIATIQNNTDGNTGGGKPRGHRHSDDTDGIDDIVGDLQGSAEKHNNDKFLRGAI